MNDFDFLAGDWRVTHRRMRIPLSGTGGWDEFSGISRCHRVFDGGASFDEACIPERGFRGLTLRLFDRTTGQWWLYWANSRDGRLQARVSGTFSDGVGTHGET